MTDQDLARGVIRKAAEEMLSQAVRFARQVEANGGRDLFDVREDRYTRDDWETTHLAGDRSLAELVKIGANSVGVTITPLTALRVDAGELIDAAAEGGSLILQSIEEEFAGLGNHGLDKVSEEARAELDTALNAVITAWVIRHGIYAECCKDIVDRVKIGPVGGDHDV